MSTGTKPKVDTNSASFEAGVEAGLNSQQETKDWQAGNELGQELKDEGGNQDLGSEGPRKKPSTPLFMRNSPGGDKGNAQDEKDGTEE